MFFQSEPKFLFIYVDTMTPSKKYVDTKTMLHLKLTNFLSFLEQDNTTFTQFIQFPHLLYINCNTFNL